ncbi:hypothetical protein GOODEAATRI_027887, partial [Goodea atripinnis]
IIMWMLKEGRGMVHIVSKIVQFFPNKLPHCPVFEVFISGDSSFQRNTLTPVFADRAVQT